MGGFLEEVSQRKKNFFPAKLLLLKSDGTDCSRNGLSEGLVSDVHSHWGGHSISTRVKTGVCACVCVKSYSFYFLYLKHRCTYSVYTGIECVSGVKTSQ